VKVYYPFRKYISRAMHRIRKALMEFAPEGVGFVEDPGRADLHILDFIGQHPAIEDRELHPETGLLRDIPSLPVCENYAILYHCPPGPANVDPLSGVPHLKLDYHRLFEEAKLVIGYLNPTSEAPWGNIDWSKVNYFMTPWGYDPKIFHYDGERKDIFCLMTGYVKETEALDVVYTAAKMYGGYVVHVGGNVGLDGAPGYRRYEGIDDAFMRELYARSQYVNAIRLEGGFEVVGIEGAACHAQPIYVDEPCYRRWFDDIGIFVDPHNLFDGIAEVFKLKARREGVAEKVKRFEWRNIAPKIWEKILEAI